MARDNVAFWENIDIPEPFYVSNDGLYAIDENDKDILISSRPLVPTALVRDVEGQNWKAIIKYVDMDGNEREVTIPLQELRNRNIVSKFSSIGYLVRYGRDKLLMEYLTACCLLTHSKELSRIQHWDGKGM